MSAERLLKIYLYRRIGQAKLFIDSNFAESIDVGEIAGKAGYSKFHFIRAFKSVYGKTPHQYLTAVRIEKAKELLEAGKSVTEACFSVGFNSLGSFTTLFKRRTGLSPSEYRRVNPEQKREILENRSDSSPPVSLNILIQNSNFREAKKHSILLHSVQNKYIDRKDDNQIKSTRRLFNANASA